MMDYEAPNIVTVLSYLDRPSESNPDAVMGLESRSSHELSQHGSTIHVEYSGGYI